MEMGFLHPDGLWRWFERVDHGVSGRKSSFHPERYLQWLSSWAHEICTADNEERALVIGSMNEMAYVVQAWLPLIVWQQVEAPQYQKGFITVSCISVLLIITAFVVRALHQRQKRLVSLSIATMVPLGLIWH
jgi:ACS family pantothenate transporter-like MFS transporter